MPPAPVLFRLPLHRHGAVRILGHELPGSLNSHLFPVTIGARHAINRDFEPRGRRFSAVIISPPNEKLHGPVIRLPNVGRLFGLNLKTRPHRRGFFITLRPSPPSASLFGAAIFWTSLNPAAPRNDERVHLMTDEAGRTGRRSSADGTVVTICPKNNSVPMSGKRPTPELTDQTMEVGRVRLVSSRKFHTAPYPYPSERPMKNLQRVRTRRQLLRVTAVSAASFPFLALARKSASATRR